MPAHLVQHYKRDPFLNNPDYHAASSIHEFRVRDLDGVPVNLDKYRGLVCLIVNVASKSPFTVFNYKQLKRLYDRFEGDGLRILAFPCNQFNESEPGDREQLKQFVKTHNIRFDVFDKINVNCEGTSPLWMFLKSRIKNERHEILGNMIKCSFTKFLVDRQGVPVLSRMGPDTDLRDLEKLCRACLYPELEQTEGKSSNSTINE